MKAVFLDRATFSNEIDLPKPNGITDYQVYDHTDANQNTDKQANQLVIQRCQEADIIITNKVILSRETLQALPNLKLIQLTATGMNNIDSQACQDLGIILKNIAGYAVKSVPEHTFMLMLNAMRASRHYHQAVSNEITKDDLNQDTLNQISQNTQHKTQWQVSERFCLLDETIYDLEGKTLGIIGMGTIGKRVAEIAKVFGMRVLIAERQGRAVRRADYTAFETVLAKSDIISLHCPLTSDTQHLINTNTIHQMHKKPLIINVARGGVVDSQAMATAIINGDVFGYASDVFEIEPIPQDDPLLAIANHPRVFYTPHNAWGSLSAQKQLWQMLCKQVADFVAADTSY